jgi:oligopeptidase A
VITLFHESGHGLHHLLTQVSALGVSGINGVEWDAVELPSQFMENFCWEWEVLEKMTSHAETGKPFFIWFAFGIAVYFLYSRKRSNLSKK